MIKNIYLMKFQRIDSFVIETKEVEGYSPFDALCNLAHSMLNYRKCLSITLLGEKNETWTPKENELGDLSLPLTH